MIGRSADLDNGGVPRCDIESWGTLDSPKGAGAKQNSLHLQYTDLDKCSRISINSTYAKTVANGDPLNSPNVDGVAPLLLHRKCERFNIPPGG